MADEISGLANTVYADGPTGTPTQPPKPDIRTLFGIVQAQVDSAKALATTSVQWKEPVRVASTATVPISTGLENGDVIDGVTIATGDRVLLKNSTVGSLNGIYVVVASGAASRATDADEASDLLGMAVFVREGTANAGKQFVCTTPSPITVGTTALVFAEISDQSALNANLATKADQSEVDALELSKAWQDQFETVYGDALLDSEFAEAYVSEDGTRILGGWTHDGRWEAIDSYALLDSVFKYAETDSSGNVLWGIKHDDTFWANGLGDGGATVDDGTTQVMARAGQIIVYRDGVRSPITFADYNENPSVAGDFVSYMRDTGTAISSRTEEIKCSTSLDGAVAEVCHYLMFGQSLSEGSLSVPSAHTSAVRAGRAVMFIAGVRVRGSGSGLAVVPPQNEYSWVDALEAEQESPALALSWGMTAAGRLDADQAALVSAHGVGGRTYAELKKGTVPYANLLEAVRRARVMAERNDLDYSVESVSWIQGESNRLDAKATYKAYMVELQSDLTDDLNALTGEPDEVLLAMDQISNFTAYSVAYSEVPFAQLEVAIENPTKMLCVGPKYMVPYVADGVHLPAASSAIIGSYHARAIDKHRKWMKTGTGTPWKPLYCTGAVRVGAVITLTMHVPVGSLTLDTSAVTDPGNNGITWNQTGGTARTISSVAVVGNTIVVTLSGDPGSPGASSVGIAAVGTPMTNGGPTTGARSNFRDQATETDIDGNIMRNWACHQLIAL